MALWQIFQYNYPVSIKSGWDNYMWILLTILAAFFNALWTALSKKQLGEISPFQFTLMFRAITTLLLLPPFLIDFKLSSSPVFWLAVLGAGALEVIGIYSQSIGVKKDFYSTFSLANTSPLFIIFIAPIFLPEKITPILVIGALLMISGGVIFYKISPHISIHGIMRALYTAVAAILAKIAIGYSSGFTYPFITFVIGIWLMVLVSPFKRDHINWKKFRPFTKKLLPLAVFSALATLFYYLAVEKAQITRVNPLIRMNLVFGFLLSYYLLHEREHVKRKILASGLILAGSLLVSIS